MSLRCLWLRRWLGAYLDGALPLGRTRAVAAHVADCAGCRGEISRQQRLREALRAALEAPGDPDWSGFWDGIRRRIAARPLPPRRLAWRGAPTMAVGSALAAGVALAILFWPVGPVEPPAPGQGVTVNAVEASPDGSVMLFSSPDDDVTVIWVIGPDQPGPADQSLMIPAARQSLPA
jgi:anti-sigma factor RsiW